MAEYTYDTRKKVTENWLAYIRKQEENLSSAEKDLLPTNYSYSISRKSTEWMEGLLDDGKCQTLSELYQKHLANLVKACIPAGMDEEFYYALDQMTAGWWRRSMRSKSYTPFVRSSIQLLWAYSRLKFYQASLGKILTGEVEPEIYDHARTNYWAYSSMLAAQIDRGNAETIQAVKDILLGEGNTAMLSHEMIRGMLKCKDKSMYKLLGDFLLAARLQEGARQAVCEAMDEGRPEAFLHLFQVIEDNQLIRYSSIRRAVSTWIGIFNEKSVDRLTEKLVRLMGQCLRNKEFCEEQLQTEDSVAISCAIWAKGFYDVKEAVTAIQKLVREGSRHQMITASYYIRSIQDVCWRLNASKGVICKYTEDLELVSCFFPGLAYSIGQSWRELLDDGSPYYLRSKKAVKPKQLPLERFFDSRKEAEEIYLCLQKIYQQLPKKGIVIDPCIFPWHQVVLTRQDVAGVMGIIA